MRESLWHATLTWWIGRGDPLLEVRGEGWSGKRVTPSFCGRISKRDAGIAGTVHGHHAHVVEKTLIVIEMQELGKEMRERTATIL